MLTVAPVVRAMSLQLPLFLYGSYRDVRRACARKLKALERGASFSDIVDSWLDLDSTPGLLVLDGPSRMPAAEPDFQCFALTYALVQTWSQKSSAELDALQRQWFERSLAAPWTFLGLLGQDGGHQLKNTDLPRFLERAIALWPELHAVGPRYSSWQPHGEPLERCALTVQYALARQGVPTEAVKGIGAAGPGPLFASSPGRRVLDQLAHGDVEQAVSELRTLEERQDAPRVVTCTLADYFVMKGHTEAAVKVIRELARTSDPHGHLLGWLSNQAGNYVDDQTAEDVFQACLRGGTSEDWARLRRLGPADSATRVLTELERRADWRTLMFCLIHHTHDFERALRLWDDQARNVRDVQWAAAQLADGIALRHPTRASELYVFAAEAHLGIGKRRVYRDSAALVAKACTLLRATGRERDALELVSSFRSRHAKRRLLLAAMTQQGL